MRSRTSETNYEATFWAKVDSPAETQAAVAQSLGVTKTTVSAIINYRRRWSRTQC